MEDWYTISQSLGYDSPESMLRDLYIEQARSTYEIANMCNVTAPCIRRKMREYDIPLKPRGGANNTTMLREIAKHDPTILKQDALVLAKKYRISRWTVYHLRWKYLGKGGD